jgi:O-acetyl-ADP-ribose deacetylase (regulator of RNase III)
MRITLERGDITEQHTDAVVNAANSSLLGGGGVDGAIHHRGGPAIAAECRLLRASRYPGDLPARWVIHTVGPVYSRTHDRSAVLASCYVASLRVADELGAKTVAFPAVSAGAFGWPLDDAARIALTTVSETSSQLDEARFVLFSGDTHACFRRVLASLARD